MNSRLVHFILEHAEQLPLHKRIEIYRETLLFLPNDSSFKKTREELTEILERLQSIEEQTRQLLLSLNLKP